MSLADFRGARLFENIEGWQLLVEETRKCGGFVNKLGGHVASKGEACLLHPMIYHKNKMNVSFPHHEASGNFENMEKLYEHFHKMPEEKRNLKNVRQRPGDAQTLMNGLLNRRCVQIVEPKDKERLTLNPAGLLDRGNGKTQLLVHFLGNAAYRAGA